MKLCEKIRKIVAREHQQPFLLDDRWSDDQASCSSTRLPEEKGATLENRLRMQIKDEGSPYSSPRNCKLLQKGATLENGLRMQIKELTEELQAVKYQVGVLQEDIEKQVQLKLAFKLHAVNLGDNLKVCLQALHERQTDHRPVREPTDWNEHCLDVDDAREKQGGQEHHRLWSVRKQAQENGWYISETEIELRELLGSGATSDTYRGIWHGVDVAVKCIRPDFFEDKAEATDAFCQELELLSRLRHPYVVRFLGACLSPPHHAWIVTECLSSGTVTEWLHGDKKRSWPRKIDLPPFSERLQIAIEISQGMQYLHGRHPKVVHRDLKPSNIFLNDYHRVRIADFGFAMFLNVGAVALTGETGTYVYMAPEVVRHDAYDEKCDVYSFGVLLCELITGEPPYIDTTLTPPEIAFAVADGKLRPTLPSCRMKSAPFGGLVELISCAWDQDPKKRPTFATITSRLTTLATQFKEIQEM